MARPKIYVCIDCDAEFRIAHNMDEDYYQVTLCPFCGAETETEDEFDEE